MVLRYWYLIRGSWPRLLEIIYWPVIHMIWWGFFSKFMATNSSWVAHSVGVLLAALLLWDVFFRAELGVAVSFLEEMWSRNLANLWITPLRPHEWMVAMCVISLLRALIGAVPAAMLAIWLFDYSVFDLGWPLMAFFFNLAAMGWWLALMVIALILRHGLGAESLAWIAVFLVAPISCVYYPLAALPDWLAPVAQALPSTHIFEGLRSVIFGSGPAPGHLLAATILNTCYLSAGVLLLHASIANTRRRGAVFQGE